MGGRRQVGQLGSVKSTCRRSGVTSSSTPAIAPTARDQAPAAQTTVRLDPAERGLDRDHRAVRGSMPTTSQSRDEPGAVPARPLRVALHHGLAASACPSSGQNAPASTSPSSSSGYSSATSAGVTIRLGTSSEFCSSTPASKAATAPRR